MFGAFTCLVNFWHSQCDLRLSTSIKKKFHLWWIHIAGPLQFCATLVGYLPGSKFYVSEKTIPQAFTQHCHNGLENRAGELWGEYRGGSRQTPHPSICIIITAVNWSPGRASCGDERMCPGSHWSLRSHCFAQETACCQAAGELRKQSVQRAPEKAGTAANLWSGSTC